jgi:acyl-coenzyme A thioesterase PaaI-like protein
VVRQAVLSKDELQQILRDAFPTTTQRVEEVSALGVIVSQPLNDSHGRPGGTVSGPSIMAMADSAAWLAIMSRIGPVVLAVTTSLHIDFLRKPEIRDLYCEADILKLGARLAVVHAKVRSEGSPELVASAQVTYSIPPR